MVTLNTAIVMLPINSTHTCAQHNPIQSTTPSSEPDNHLYHQRHHCQHCQHHERAISFEVLRRGIFGCDDWVYDD